MELFDENIEQLILQKEYFELSKEEKNSLAEFISNEDEYAQFKMTLLMSSDLKTENIQARKETKVSLLQILENSKPESKVWYNSLFLFFFPENKPSYVKPGIYFALGAIAITVFLMVPMDYGTVQSEKKEMALAEDDKMSEEGILTETEVLEDERDTKSLDNNLQEEDSDENEQMEAPVELTTMDDVLSEQPNVMGGAFFDDAQDDEAEDNGMELEDLVTSQEKLKKKDVKDITIDYSAGVYSKSDKESNTRSPSDDFGGKVVNGTGASTITSTSKNEAKHSSKTMGYISGDVSKESFRVEVLNDNALSQNKNLIDILYTAD